MFKLPKQIFCQLTIRLNLSFFSIYNGEGHNTIVCISMCETQDFSEVYQTTQNASIPLPDGDWSKTGRGKNY